MNTPAWSTTTPDRCAGLDFNVPLSATEREVARLVACGLPNRDIAARMQLSENTIKFHLLRLFRVTGASTRLRLVVWMYESGHVLPGALQMPDVPSRPRHVRNEPLTAEHIATLNLPSLHHQLTTTRAALDRLITLFGPHARAGRSALRGRDSGPLQLD